MHITSDHPLDGPWAKVERAHEHIDDLESTTRFFFERHGNSFHCDVQREAGDVVVRVSRSDPLPTRWSTMIGDAVHNLRSALDLLVYQLVVVNAEVPTTETGFPVAASANRLEAMAERKVKGASQGAIQLIRATNPYPGGNDALWQLHRLSIADKHRLLVVVGTAVIAFQESVDNVVWAGSDVEDWGGPIYLEDGMEMFRIPCDDLKGHRYVQFSLQVAFGKGEIVEGQPVVPTLRELANAVEQVLEAFRPLLDAGRVLGHDSTANT